MWTWILISVVVVPIVVVGAAALFVNAVDNAFSRFADRTLFRWPDGWWPIGRRFSLPSACMAEADRDKKAPQLNLAGIHKAVVAFSAQAEAAYAAHQGEKSTYSKNALAEARSNLAKAIEGRDLGGDQELTWMTYASACEFYAIALRRLKPPS